MKMSILYYIYSFMFIYLSWVQIRRVNSEEPGTKVETVWYTPGNLVGQDAVQKVCTVRFQVYSLQWYGKGSVQHILHKVYVKMRIQNLWKLPLTQVQSRQDSYHQNSLEDTDSLNRIFQDGNSHISLTKSLFVNLVLGMFPAFNRSNVSISSLSSPPSILDNFWISLDGL